MTVAERWNGLSWKIQVTPNPSSQTSLSGVWCGSPVTCRAVGYYNVSSGEKSLAEGD